MNAIVCAVPFILLTARRATLNERRDGMRPISFKKLVLWFIKLAAAGIIALIVVSVFSFVYSYSGAHIRNRTGSTDYKYEPGQIVCNLKEGFSFFRMDDNGFHNAAVCKDVDILLMGSSHMEAVQVGKKNVAVFLNELLPGYHTYNIGMSGHTIYRLADNIRNAVDEYRPSKYVVIEMSSVELDPDGMRDIINGKGKKISVRDDGVFAYLQKVPAFTSLYDQADRWIRKTGDVSSGLTQKQAAPGGGAGRLPEGYVDTLSSFLRIFSEACPENVRCVLLYVPPESIGRGGLVCRTDETYLKTFEDRCEKEGLIFVDCTPALEKLHSESVPAHGFCNGGVAVGHINERGHEAVAEFLAERLRSEVG